MSTLKQVMREANEAITRKPRPLNEGKEVSPAECWEMITRVAEKHKFPPVHSAKDVSEYVIDAFNNHPSGRDKPQPASSWYNLTERVSKMAGDMSEKFQDINNGVTHGYSTDASYAKYVAASPQDLAWKVVYYDALFKILDRKIQ